MIVILLIFLLISYISFIGFIWFAWNQIKIYQPQTYTASTKVSVIVPVKNEAKNIEQLLFDFNQQTYQNFEIIIINDASSDNTLEILNQFSAGFELKIIDLKPSEKQIAYKKGAVQVGFQNTTGELILTTDGDCRVGKNWIATYAQFYEDKNAKFISGPVSFYQEVSWFERIQTIEFSSLIGSGASFMQLGYPNMCNGANLAYTKTVFEEVNAFQGNDQIASGDDEFLLHKIYEKYPNDVYFLKSPDVIVSTKAHQTWKGFYHQRKRWASKWNAYQFNYIILLAIGVFLLNFILSIGMSFCFFELISHKKNWTTFPYEWLLIVFMVRLGGDYIYLNKIMRFLGKKINWVDFITLSFLYIYYISFFGILANLSGGYQWKNQKIKK